MSYDTFDPNRGRPDNSQSGYQAGFSRDGSFNRPGGAAPSPWMSFPYSAPGHTSYGYRPQWDATPRRKSGRGGLTAAIIMLAISLIVASTILAASMGSNSAGKDIFGDRYAEFYTGEWDAPDGDYYDFFADYFDSDTVSGIYDIARAETGTGVKLELSASQGLQQLTLQQIYVKLIPSVVGIKARTEDSQDGYFWGTGIIFTSDGYIITNSHVIDGTTNVTVALYNGTEYEARLVGADASSDIAVLKIEANGLTAAEFGSLEGLAVGDGVAAIGNPLGEQYSGTMTDGIISAIDRNIDYGGHSMTLLQTNAALNEGNSGGPLVNMFGQVIGITNMKMMSYYSTIEGIGFAIPSTVVKTMVDALIQDGYIKGVPALGITCGTVPQKAKEAYDLPDGLYVNDVAKNSDAYKQGIQIGDIITHANGEPTATLDDITRIKDGLVVGDTMELTIYRDGETFNITVMLMERNELYG